MAERNYWLDLFTAVTWQEFLDAGANLSGFRDSRWNTLQKVKVGDYFLCYLTGVSRWIGLLEVTSAPFQDTSPVWKDESFPCRLTVRVVAKLTPENGIPVKEMKDQLSVFRTSGGGALAWTGHFRGSPTKWKVGEAEEQRDIEVRLHRHQIAHSRGAPSSAAGPRATNRPAVHGSLLLWATECHTVGMSAPNREITSAQEQVVRHKLLGSTTSDANDSNARMGGVREIRFVSEANGLIAQNRQCKAILISSLGVSDLGLRLLKLGLA
jgi:hypothetical protein